IDERRRHDHRMPPVKARVYVPKKPRRVTNPNTSAFARELAERAEARKRVVTDINLKGDFEHVAGRGHAEESGDTDKAPTVRRTIRDHRASKRRIVTDVNLQGDFEHAAMDRGDYSGEDGTSSDGPQGTVISTRKPPRPRRPRTRKRDKDFDRDR
ncbi:MAG: hypothetical protein JNJ76_03720, partial [Candidatus Competibacter sp.]|nr:hypothetical protein [Candidatus Competibacter sp.]